MTKLEKSNVAAAGTTHRGTLAGRLLHRPMVLLTVVICTCFAVIGTALAATRVQMFLPISTIGWGFYLAEKNDYFKSAGIDAEIKVFSSGMEAGQAFQALKADMLEAGDMPSMLLTAGGAGAFTIVAQVARSEHAIQLIGPKGIRGPADFKGKTIATIFGTTSEYYVRKYVEDNGLDGQVKIINLDPGSQPPALMRGDVDAIATFLSFGVRLLADQRFHIINSWGSSLMLVVSKNFAESHPDAVESVLRILVRSANEIKSNPKAAMAAVAGMHGLVAQAYEDDLSYGGLDVSPQFTKSTLDFMAGISNFLVEQHRLRQPFDFCHLVDLRYLRAVDAKVATGVSPCQ